MKSIQPGKVQISAMLPVPQARAVQAKPPSEKPEAAIRSGSKTPPRGSPLVVFLASSASRTKGTSLSRFNMAVAMWSNGSQTNIQSP
ncbi:MAG: hypothetical protein A2Z99_16050 [Treponema sp. GWB1_62_6]|nr:MAG: hypothetical protein A2Z99_16050 [Treponema sp. GWB1_62_6]